MLISSKENESHATYYFLILIVLNTIFGAQHNITLHATMILRFLSQLNTRRNQLCR